MQHLEVRIHRLLSVHQETKCLQSTTPLQWALLWRNHWITSVLLLSNTTFLEAFTFKPISFFLQSKSLLDWVWRKISLVLWRLAKQSKPTNSTSATGSWTLHCWHNALPPKSLLITWVAAITKQAGDPNGDSFLYWVSTHHTHHSLHLFYNCHTEGVKMSLALRPRRCHRSPPPLSVVVSKD